MGTYQPDYTPSKGVVAVLVGDTTTDGNVDSNQVEEDEAFVTESSDSETETTPAPILLALENTVTAASLSKTNDDNRTVRSSASMQAQDLLDDYLNQTTSLNLLQKLSLPHDFFNISSSSELTPDNINMIDDFNAIFKIFQRRHGLKPAIGKSPETQIKPANASYALRHMGTLYSSIGYAHVSFVINISEVFSNLEGVCGCADGMSKLYKKLDGHANATQQQVLLQQHYMVLKAGCVQTKGRLEHIMQTFNVIKEGVPTNARRFKRQLIAGAALLLASISGLFSASALLQVALDSGRSNENQDFIVEVLAKEEVRLNRTYTDEIVTRRVLTLLEAHIRSREVLQDLNMATSMCMYELHSISDHVDRLISGLQALLDNSIHSNLVAPRSLEKVSQRLEARLEKIGYAPISKEAADLYQSTASFLSANGMIIGFIHIPIHRVSLNLELYQYLAVPVTSPNHTGHYYLIQPDTTYLAINHDMEVFREFTEDQFKDCTRMDRIYYCPMDNILDRYPTITCLTSIYRHMNISDFCEIELLLAKDHLIQTSDVTFRLFQPVMKRVEVTCPTATNKRSLSTQIKGLVDITVPYGCQGRTESFIFTPRVTAEASVNATHLVAWSFEELLGMNVTDRLSDVFFELHQNNTHRVTLREVRARLLADLPHPLMKHLPILTGAGVVVNAFVTTLVVTVIVYLCCSKKTWRRRSGYVKPVEQGGSSTVNVINTLPSPAIPLEPTLPSAPQK